MEITCNVTQSCLFLAGLNLFFIEIYPNTTYILQTKQADNEMINFNFIFAENSNNKMFVNHTI